MSRILCMRTPRRLLSHPLLNATIRNTRRYASSAPQFDWEDPLASKTLLTEDELAIAETAERYCQEELAPRVLRMAHTNPQPEHFRPTDTRQQRHTAMKIMTPKFSARWASWACSAQPFPKNMVARR